MKDKEFENEMNITPTHRGVMDRIYANLHGATCAETGDKISAGERFLYYKNMFYCNKSKHYDQLINIDLPIFDWGI